MKLTPDTCNNITELQELTKAPTEADAVAYAVNLALLVTQTERDGGKLVFQKADGSSHRLVLGTFDSPAPVAMLAEGDKLYENYHQALEYGDLPELTLAAKEWMHWCLMFGQIIVENLRDVGDES